MQVCAPNGEEAPLEIIQTVKANLTNYEFRYETSLCGLHSLHVLLRGVPIQVCMHMLIPHEACTCTCGTRSYAAYRSR